MQSDRGSFFSKEVFECYTRSWQRKFCQYGVNFLTAPHPQIFGNLFLKKGFNLRKKQKVTVWNNLDLKSKSTFTKRKFRSKGIFNNFCTPKCIFLLFGGILWYTTLDKISRAVHFVQFTKYRKKYYGTLANAPPRIENDEIKLVDEKRGGRGVARKNRQIKIQKKKSKNHKFKRKIKGKIKLRKK